MSTWSISNAVERLLRGRVGPETIAPLTEAFSSWLANSLGRMGRGLRAGDIMLTGSISKILRPKAGESVRASFTRLGSVACRFV